MPKYTIETTYDLPVFRHKTYVADTPAEACRIALEDEDWERQKEDVESSSKSRITGMWEGEDSAYRGAVITPVPVDPMPPDQGAIRGVVQRRFDEAAEEVLGGLYGTATPGIEVAISAALDILARALLQIRTEDAYGDLRTMREGLRPPAAPVAISQK